MDVLLYQQRGQSESKRTIETVDNNDIGPFPYGSKNHRKKGAVICRLLKKQSRNKVAVVAMRTVLTRRTKADNSLQRGNSKNS